MSTPQMHGSAPANEISRRLTETAEAVLSKSSVRAKVGIVLGSGLGAFGDTLGRLEKIPYGELPHMPISKVVGHAGNLCLGYVGDVPVVCMQGRVHLYEGHPIAACVHGVRTMAKLGVTSVLLTNAAGGLDPTWSAGELMLLTDHMNLMGQNPLTGPNDDSMGPRFPDMSYAYDAGLRAALKSVAAKEGIAIREGVYAGLLGPTYETPAEVRMLQKLGAQAVGMSTVHEVIALRHMGIRVGALSCITNQAAGISPHALDHKEVEMIAKEKRNDLIKLLSGWILEAGKL